MSDQLKAEEPRSCERRLWHAPRGGVSGGYFTCGGRLSDDTCRTCGHVTPSACQDCGHAWTPVRRGECIACGSDAGPLVIPPGQADPS